jgi:hypothetical protein
MSLIAMLVFAATFAVSQTAARADHRTVRDGDDTRGPLDLRSAEHAHDGDTLVHRLVTRGTWSARQLKGDNFFLIGFNTEGSSDFDRCVFAFGVRSRLRAVMTNCGRRALADVATSHPSGRVLSVALDPSLLGDVAGYTWGAFSSFEDGRECAAGCVDAAPNRPPGQLHDIVAPTIDFIAPVISAVGDFDAGVPYSSIPEELYVRFATDDDGGLGVVRWAIQRRVAGTSAWDSVLEGDQSHAQSTFVVHGGVEGTHYEFRALSVDIGRNRTTTPVADVLVPFDDTRTSRGLEYSGSGWELRDPFTAAPQCNPPEPSCGTFLNTQHFAHAQGDSLAATFDGTGIVVMGRSGPNAGTVNVTVDGVSHGTIDLRTVPTDAFLSVEGLPVGTHRVTVTAATVGVEYAFAVDAIGVLTT